MDVVRAKDVNWLDLTELSSRFQLTLERVAPLVPIPGSYWGESEAGLILDCLYARPDTPVHSVLHETSHFVCMTPARRARLHCDAGGDDAEEDAVCYLQVLLSRHVGGVTRERLFHDMDTWGYSFRLGSTTRWFHEDADDARAWLSREAILAPDGEPTWRRRGDGASAVEQSAERVAL